MVKSKKKSTEKKEKSVGFQETSSQDGASSGTSNSLQRNGPGLKPSPSMNTLNRMEREKITILRKPHYVFPYAFMEVCNLVGELIYKILEHKVLLTLSIASFIAAICAYHAPGAHQQHVQEIEKNLIWWSWWVFLGILSSVGLGSGLHTFLIYLGPHIAAVTLAAYECQSLDFPEPPYPQELQCPTEKGGIIITLWQIMAKVRVESLLWGAGTAIGELPPYFMARAARLSGQQPDDEEYREFLALMDAGKNANTNELSWSDRGKQWVEKFIARVGFPGILLFASIPNPLFDLAGITCGHFLVPFWSFFGATLIGKALVKMHVQMLFVIVAFSEHHAEHVVDLLSKIPVAGPYIRKMIVELLEKQRGALHTTPGKHVEQSASILQMLLGGIVFVMIAYFLCSIIQSLAQAYHKRLYERSKKQKKVA